LHLTCGDVTAEYKLFKKLHTQSKISNCLMYFVLN